MKKILTLTYILISIFTILNLDLKPTEARVRRFYGGSNVASQEEGDRIPAFFIWLGISALAAACQQN